VSRGQVTSFVYRALLATAISARLHWATGTSAARSALPIKATSVRLRLTWQWSGETCPFRKKHGARNSRDMTHDPPRPHAEKHKHGTLRVYNHEYGQDEWRPEPKYQYTNKAMGLNVILCHRWKSNYMRNGCSPSEVGHIIQYVGNQPSAKRKWMDIT
jgi:hypothetical protein